MKLRCRSCKHETETVYIRADLERWEQRRAEQILSDEIAISTLVEYYGDEDEDTLEDVDAVDVLSDLDRVRDALWENAAEHEFETLDCDDSDEKNEAFECPFCDKQNEQLFEVFELVDAAGEAKAPQDDTDELVADLNRLKEKLRARGIAV